MAKYVKHRKSLASKSSKRSKSCSSDQPSHLSPGEASAPTSAGTPIITEERIGQLMRDFLIDFKVDVANSVSLALDEVRNSFDQRMDNMDCTVNALISAPSLAQVDVGANQTSTDPSVAFHRSDLGSGGGLQEPVQAESVTPSFLLLSLRAAGITVPQGLVIRG